MVSTCACTAGSKFLRAREKRNILDLAACTGGTSRKGQRRREALIALGSSGRSSIRPQSLSEVQIEEGAGLDCQQHLNAYWRVETRGMRPQVFLKQTCDSPRFRLPATAGSWQELPLPPGGAGMGGLAWGAGREAGVGRRQAPGTCRADPSPQLNVSLNAQRHLFHCLAAVSAGSQLFQVLMDTLKCMVTSTLY